MATAHKTEKPAHDTELTAKIQAVIDAHKQSKTKIPPEVSQRPRFVFSRATPDRAIGSPVRVRNGLDEDPAGGTIVEKIGRAYRVDLGFTVIIVHEPDDSWD